MSFEIWTELLDRSLEKCEKLEKELDEERSIVGELRDLMLRGGVYDDE